MALPSTIKIPDITGTVTGDSVTFDTSPAPLLQGWTKQASGNPDLVTYLPDSQSGYVGFSALTIRKSRTKKQYVCTKRLQLAPSLTDSATSSPVAMPEKLGGYLQIEQTLRVPVGMPKQLAETVIIAFSGLDLTPALVDTDAEIAAILVSTGSFALPMGRGTF